MTPTAAEIRHAPVSTLFTLALPHLEPLGNWSLSAAAGYTQQPAPQHWHVEINFSCISVDLTVRDCGYDERRNNFLFALMHDAGRLGVHLGLGLTRATSSYDDPFEGQPTLELPARYRVTGNHGTQYISCDAEAPEDGLLQAFLLLLGGHGEERFGGLPYVPEDHR